MSPTVFTSPREVGGAAWGGDRLFRPPSDPPHKGEGAGVHDPLPAIDLKDGLRAPAAGRDGARDRVQSRPGRAGARLRDSRASKYLHIVDLDGAFAGKPVNAEAVERILEAISIPVQLGGGIRDIATIEAWLDKGVTRVILGTAAVRDPDLVRRRRASIPDRIAVGHRRARRQGRGRRLGGNVRADRARARAPLRGRGRRRHHLHRHRARRRADGAEPRSHHCARARDLRFR